jgi:hypothetical protein
VSDDQGVLDIVAEQDADLSARTPAQALRARQAARIATGVHPLALDGATIRLHPDAGAAGGPTCGTCVHRVLMGGHAKDYPKCVFGTTVTPIPPEQQRRHGPTRIVTQPRVTNGAATDVRAWWPACTDWAATEASTPGEGA